mmetsp:Transcript_43970/g.102568  ORF Transcript_43970/g.102568 Transcript_43970/m.102568 type:complete len:241 (-) Transcript_43970:609-1331(-)
MQVRMAIVDGDRPRPDEALQPSSLVAGKEQHCIRSRPTGIIAVATIATLVATALPALSTPGVASAIFAPVAGHRSRDGIGCQPSATVVLSCKDGASISAILAVDEAQIGVEHHLVTVEARVTANVAALPLILASIASHSELWDPAFGQQRNEVIVVKTTGVLRIAPPSVVAGVAHLCTTQAVDTHQSCSLRPVQAHAIQKRLLNGVAAVLWIWQTTSSKVTGDCSSTAETERGAQIKLRG